MTRHPSSLGWRAFCLAVSIVLVPAGAAAQDEASAEEAPSFRPLGRETLSEASALSATEATFPPGYSSPSHRHAGSLFVYVLEGEVRSGLNGEPSVLYRAGESWFEPAGVEHSFFGNVNDTAPLRVLIVSVGPPPAPPSDPEN